MPSTINGVGTHYYGQRNSDVRSATCHSCGRPANLLSYDTRLWFVVLYIPIIPLGRKRIIDQCPYCKRHYVIAALQWETQKQLDVSGALDRYHSEGTPEAAMEAHQRLLNYRQSGEAAELRREMAEKFRQNARVQAYLGQALSGAGLGQDAQVYFQRALDLRPDLPEARVGVALDHINHGRLEEARTLLDFLEKPGAAQLYSLEPLEILGNAYQQRMGGHETALEIYHALLKELPQIGDIPAFRAKVERSEKAARVIQRSQGTSILPKQKFSWKRFFGMERGWSPSGTALGWGHLRLGGVILGLVALGFLVANEYIRRHRELYLVNASKNAATVEVQGVGTVHVGPGHQTLTLKEGRYHAIVNGPLHEEFDFDVRTNFWGRWGDDTVWLLNVGGAALILENRVTYQNNPPPPTIGAHYGQRIEKIDHITHPFATLPASLMMKRSEVRVLASLEVFDGQAADLIAHFQEKGDKPNALKLAEWRLQQEPTDKGALAAFISLADPPRAERVLRAGLSHRPVIVDWHRAYEDLKSTGEWKRWLRVEYDAMLAAEPTNASLLYLRGRVAGAATAVSWYERATAADPQNPSPLYGLAYHRFAAGDLTAARDLYARVTKLAPDRIDAQEMLFLVRLALREFPALESDLHAALQAKPQDFMIARRLVQVLAMQGRKTEAEGVLTTYTKSVQKLGQASADYATAALRQTLLYAAGDLAALEAIGRKDRTPDGRVILLTAYVEQGRMAEAEQLAPGNPAGKDENLPLVMALGWLTANEPTKAQPWLQKALLKLRAGSEDDAAAAALLEDPAPTVEKWREIVLETKSKAILAATDALLHPAQQRELKAYVRALNTDPSFPYHLLRRVAGDQP